jgi:serine protease Do
MNPAFRRFLSLCLVFLVCFLGVSLLRNVGSGKPLATWWASLFQAPSQFQPETYSLPHQSPLALGDVGLLHRLNDEYAKLTKAVVPSVVSIDTTGVRTERMLDFWGRTRIRQYPTQGQGSGAIVTTEGHIVTNHHVIAGQNKIRVTLHDGRTLDAKLIGEDSLLDIAVLKIESRETFTPLKLGDSSQVEVGQLVFAIGNPFGLGETVTQGIISAKERSLSDNQRDLFQTDAAINPGNSGGPLVNILGEIIGINVAIFSSDRDNPGFQGVGFSIPANDVRDALTQILERGRPVRGFLGVQTRDVNGMTLEQLGLPADQEGAIVVGIASGSPAETCGLQPWDIVVAFDNKRIRSASQLLHMVKSTRSGTTVALTVLRGGKESTLHATITESEESPTGASTTPEPNTPQQLEAVLRAIGIEVRDLTLRERMRGFQGVVVSKVSPNALATPHLQPGDLITAMNQDQVQRAEEFLLHLVASVSRHTTTLSIQRNGENIRVILPAFTHVD